MFMFDLVSQADDGAFTVLHLSLFYIFYCFTYLTVLHLSLFYLFDCFISFTVLHPLLLDSSSWPFIFSYYIISYLYITFELIFPIFLSTFCNKLTQICS